MWTNCLYFVCTCWPYCRTWNILARTLSGEAAFQVLGLWLMLQLLEGKPDIVFQHDQTPQHIHSEMTTFLKVSLFAAINLRESTSWAAASPYLIIPLPTHTLIFSCRVLWKMRHSANACNHEKLEESNMNKSCKDWTTYIAECWHALCYHLDVCRTTECILNLCRYENTFWGAVYISMHLVFVWLLLSYE